MYTIHSNQNIIAVVLIEFQGRAVGQPSVGPNGKTDKKQRVRVVRTGLRLKGKLCSVRVQMHAREYNVHTCVLCTCVHLLQCDDRSRPAFEVSDFPSSSVVASNYICVALVRSTYSTTAIGRRSPKSARCHVAHHTHLITGLFLRSAHAAFIHPRMCHDAHKWCHFRLCTLRAACLDVSGARARAKNTLH